MKYLLDFCKAIFTLILLLGMLFFYGIFIEPKLLTIDTLSVEHSFIIEDYAVIDQDNKQVVVVKSSDLLGKQITVAQFSDTHLGFHYDLEQLQQVVETINDYSPDIVVFTGDLIDDANSYRQIDEIAPVLSQLNAPLGKYAIYGNHDYGGGAHRYYEDIMAASGFTLLVNEVQTITLSDKVQLCIGGLDEVMLGQPDVSLVTEQFSPTAFNLLLLHEPDHIDQFTSLPNLALAGHSHGGQVQLPFWGPLIRTAYAEKYVEGTYHIDPQDPKRLLYVNIGLGTTKLPIRINACPTISLIKITF